MRESLVRRSRLRFAVVPPASRSLRCGEPARYTPIELWGGLPVDRLTEELLEIIRLTERISSHIHELESEGEIIEAVTTAFRSSKRFHAHVMMADDAGTRLRFVSTSFPPALVKLGETIAGVSMETFEIDPDRIPSFGRVFRDGETLLIWTLDALGEFLPSKIVSLVLKRMRYEGTRDVLTPLHRDGRIAGILSVTAPGLAEPFFPSMMNLARHIGSALDAAATRTARLRAERQYRDLVESVNEVFYTVDAEGRFTYLSPNVAKLGFTQEDLLGRRFGEVFEGEARDAALARFGEYLGGERASGQAVYRVRSRDGQLRWIRISSRVVEEAGRPVGLRGSIADVTEDKRREEALAESERILNETGRMAQIGGWEHDLRTGRAIWTRELYRIIEIAPETEPPGAGEHLDYYPAEDRARLSAAYDRAVREGVPFDLELRVRTASGRTLWCRAYGEPVFEDGACVKMRGTFQDIGDRKRAELARAESERRLATLMRNLPGMAYRCENDRDWTMRFVSAGARALTGYAPEELVDNRRTSFGALIHPDDREKVWTDVQDALAARSPFQIEYRIRTAAGEERWVWEQGQGVFGDGGAVVALEGFITDVTQRVHAARALEMALDGTTRAIARAVELRDPYTAGHQERVAHLSCAIAREMGECDDLIPALRVAGLLHDVGKIAVPSEILSKPTRLTDSEMRIVQEHVEASRKILEGIPFPWPVTEMVHNHHERLDGSGYPRGLVGDAIGPGARILAVADAVEAMSSHRPYRPALGIDAALEEIERGRGKEYDPDAVDACLRLFREKGLTYDALAENLCVVPRAEEDPDEAAVSASSSEEDR